MPTTSVGMAPGLWSVGSQRPTPMTVVAIIQARMGSTRLPGKVLADVAGKSMLSRVCRRVGRAAMVDRVVVATTDAPDDAAIVEECGRMDVACFRGSVDDVLDRYDRAARAFEADAVVRVTADCPLIDPRVIDQVVAAFEEGGRGHGAARLGSGPPAYASNTLRRTWPRGLDTEVFTAVALARARREAVEPFERAHVTPYLYGHPEIFPLVSVVGPERLGAMRWTVDVPEDLEFVRAVFGRLTGDGLFSWEEVRWLLRREPDLAALNRHVRQKPIAEG